MYKQKTLFGLTIALIAIVMGTALAAWTQSLPVNVTVKTGEVKVRFLEWSCSDRGADPQAHGFHNEGNRNVASCGITIEEVDEGGVIKLLVTIDNAYPGYKAEVDLKVKNVGTIPVKLHRWSSNNPSVLKVELHNPDSDPKDPKPAVIDPSGTHTYKLSIEVLDGAEQDYTYTFTVTLTFIQWNSR